MDSVGTTDPALTRYLDNGLIRALRQFRILVVVLGVLLLETSTENGNLKCDINSTALAQINVEILGIQFGIQFV